MPTEKEIKANHKEVHDNLTEDYYKNKLMSQEDFDYLHGQNWNDMEAELLAEGNIKPPEPVRDLGAEIDEIKGKLNLLISLNAQSQEKD
ncbi:hypothetical protein LCGC14_0384620 [marine sediment metagenome]|uniref:Uncharacterized protein n=1 Tax=marine sediment metagenome TaxID=412755 RepID=A0A0F9T137_9ZZZZ